MIEIVFAIIKTVEGFDRCLLDRKDQYCLIDVFLVAKTNTAVTLARGGRCPSVGLTAHRKSKQIKS